MQANVLTFGHSFIVSSSKINEYEWKFRGTARITNAMLDSAEKSIRMSFEFHCISHVVLNNQTRTSASQARGSVFESWIRPFSVTFLWSPCDCVIFWLLSMIQKHASLVR